MITTNQVLNIKRNIQRRKKAKAPLLKAIRKKMQPYVTQVGVFVTLICLVINLYIEAEAVMTIIIKYIVMDLLYCDMIEKSLNQKVLSQTIHIALHHLS